MLAASGGASNPRDNPGGCYPARMRLGVPAARGLFHDIADFVLPPSCVLCAEHGAAPLCDECSARLDILSSEPACARCAMSLPTGADCPHCIAGRARPFTRIARLAAFDEPLRQLLYHLKYHNGWRVAGDLARRLYAHSPAAAMLNAADVFVAVPLHPRRHIARGYNQAELVARSLAHLAGKRHARALLRVRDTASQTGLTAIADRHQNMRDAFALESPRHITGRRVVLIDDVTTSGATLRSAAAALLQAQPAELAAAVLAVADPRGRAFQAI